MKLKSRSSVHAAPPPPPVVPDVARHQHVVEFYDSETFLVGTVAGFIAPALRDGDAAIVVATEAHRIAFEAALTASGVDVAAAVADGRYLAFDAAERLDSFMVGGAPDQALFDDMAGGVIERAAAGGRKVRVYGEMVALLWDGGDVVSAIALEDLWNDLADRRDFMLLCAYPMRAFESSECGEEFKRICDQHSTVIPSEGYAMLGGADAQQRTVALLQQQAVALKADVSRLQADQILAELAYADALSARSRPKQTDIDMRSRSPRRAPAPAVATASRQNPHLYGSPGGRLLVESMGTLASRIRYGDTG